MYEKNVKFVYSKNIVNRNTGEKPILQSMRLTEYKKKHFSNHNRSTHQAPEKLNIAFVAGTLH